MVPGSRALYLVSRDDNFGTGHTFLVWVKFLKILDRSKNLVGAFWVRGTEYMGTLVHGYRVPVHDTWVDVTIIVTWVHG